MTTVGLLDTLEFSGEFAQTLSGISEKKLVMTCDDSALPCDARNLVIKAVMSLGGGRHLAPAASAPRMGADAGAARFLRIHLKKQIPSGGGLGGGSSDAATTLAALNHLWNHQYSISDLNGRAASLGSDVPFFLHGPSSICKGRGEAVRPISSPAKARWVLLMLPAIMMPTAAVYRKFDEMQLGVNADVEIEPDWEEWCSLPSQELLPLLVNDLEPPAFELRSDLAQLRSAIERKIDRPVRMSGSGSSLFTLFDDQDHASRTAAQVANQFQIKALAIEMTPAISSPGQAIGACDFENQAI
jgi:4-diphosphocytidyl-2-C-methyl-D-erythritol kinase